MWSRVPLDSCSPLCPLGVLNVRCPWPLGACSPVCPLGVLRFMCCVLGHLAAIHRCACLVCCVCAVLGHLAPVHRCARSVCCVCGVLGVFAPVHLCARLVCCDACAVSLATWVPITGVPAPCVVLCVQCPWPLGSRSHVCPLAVLSVRCPWPLGFRSPVCPLGVLLYVCSFLGHLAPADQCARSVCCNACAVSLPSWLLFTGVPAWCVALCVGYPLLVGSRSPVCALGVLCCLCGVLGHLAPVHRCAPSVCCVTCAVSLATWLPFTGVPACCVLLRVPCPWSLGSRSPVCTLRVLCCVCGVLGHFAHVHRCARSVCVDAYAVSLATWLPLTGVNARFVVLRVRCPWPLRSRLSVCPLAVLCDRCPWPPGSPLPVCPLGPLCSVCGVVGHLARVHRCACLMWCVFDVLGHLVPVHRCGRLMCCVACAVSLACWLSFTSVHAWYVVLPVPLGSRPSVCALGVSCCVCSVLGDVAPVHQCARLVRRVACAVSLVPWLLVTG